MPQRQHPAAAFFLVFLIIWLLFPDGEYQSQSLTLSDLAADRLSRYHSALDVLNKTKWGDFAPTVKGDDKPKFVNLTGFRELDGLAWDDLERFRERSLQISRHAMPSVRGQQLWDVGEGAAVWTNASGTLHGSWVRRQGSVSRTYDSYNLTRSMPLDWIADKTDWARNITGDTGRMLLRMEGNRTVTNYEQLSRDHAPLSGGSIRNVKGVVTIEDTSGSGFNWEMRLWGLHWPHQGVMMLTTTSEKFEGIFGLPHLTPGEDFFQSSQLMLNQTLSSVISRKEKNLYIDQNVPWSSDVENPLYTANPSPQCEYVMYAQIHPPSLKDLGESPHAPGEKHMADAIHAIESELNDPMGAPIHTIPKLQISAVMYSPDCGYFIETKGPPEFAPGGADHLQGMKTEVQLHQIKTWILVYALVIFGQVYLLKNQMKESSTPSTMGRVSFGTIGAMIVVDGMTFTASATWVSSAASTFLPTLALMFASFLSMTIGGSYLAKIHEIQIPETRGRRDRDQASTDNNNTSGTNTTAASPSPNPTPPPTGPLLPAPVTATRPSALRDIPIIVPSDGDIDAEIADNAAVVPGLNAAAGTGTTPSQALSFQSIVGRFILLSLCISFLAVASSTWYPRIRSLFLNLCVFAYLSLWTPQIYRNTMRNCRRALTWPFVIGQSVLRLLPVAYFWVKSDNFLYAQTEPTAFLIICAWVWLQIFVLAAQDIAGPRFAIPAGWTPDAWDYHPVLRADNVEAGGLPIGLMVEDNPGHERPRASEDRDNKHRSLHTIDCTICREVLEVPIVRAGEEDTSVAGVFARRMYMVTPCRHIFHTACLEGWMRFRLQCPMCREELPPL